MEQFLKIDDLQLLKENLKALQENFLFAEYAAAEVASKRSD